MQNRMSVRKLSNDQTSRSYIENLRWGKRIICPNCGSARISRYADGVLLFCSECRQQFTVTVGTIFEGSHLSLAKWLTVLRMFHTENGTVSSSEISKAIGITQKSARRILTTIESAVASEQFWTEPKKVVVKESRPLRKASDKLILTAYRGRNDVVFRNILKLYVPVRSIIADVTYGLGKFWTLVDRSEYEVLATDIQTGADFRDLPYDEASIDCVVMDPPYLHFSSGTAYENHTDFRDRYRVNTKHHETLRGHEALLELYYEGAQEAYRILKNKGILVVKCMDEVVDAKQRFTHVDLLNGLSGDGFDAEDLFVVMRYDTPTISTPTVQRHARKNHSYFLVFRKRERRKK